MTQVIVMEPGDTVARLRDVPMNDDPSALQKVIGGYFDVIELSDNVAMYIPEEATGHKPNELASRLIPEGASFIPHFRSVSGTAVLFSFDNRGNEIPPGEKAMDMLAKAGIDVAVELPNGTTLSTNVAGGIKDFTFQRASDGTRTVNSFALVNDFLLLRRDERIAQEWDEAAIRKTINEWLDSGTADIPGMRVGARLERLIQIIARQATNMDEANRLRRRLRKMAEEEIDKRQPGDGSTFAKRLETAGTERAGSLWDVPARVGYGRDWEARTKESLRQDYRDEIASALMKEGRTAGPKGERTYRGDVTEMIRRQQQ